VLPDTVLRYRSALRWLTIALIGVVTIHAGEAPVRVGVLIDNDPYSYQDTDGEIRGFAVDLLAGIERHLALNLERINGTTSEVNGRFVAGQLDLLQSYARSEAREDHADFSVPYLSMSGSIFTRQETAAGITSLEDLRGKRVLVHRGSLGERLLIDAGLADSIASVESVEEAFRQLHDGLGDATLAARLTGLATVHRLRLHRIVPAGMPLDEFAIDYCFAVQDGDRALLAKINEGLAILQRTGEFDAIHRRWFGHLNPATYTVVDVLFATSAGLTLALLIAVGFVLHQRRLRLRLAAQATALRTSEELHRGIFDASPDALLLLRKETGGNWRIEQGNRAFAALVGQTQPPVSGVSLDRYPPIESALKERLANESGRTEPAFTEHAVEVGGATRWLRAATAPVGEGLLVILSDVSAEKEARDRWHESERQLRQAQKLEAIGTLASGIAHDFNNILTGIGGNTEISRLRLPPDHPVQSHLAEVIQGAARAAALVRQILTFARKTESRRQRLDTADAIDETLRFLRAASPRSVILEHRRSPVPVLIDADPTQLQQVLMNLGTNAVQAFDGTQGGVVYAAEIDADGNPCILVSDTGPGMTPEVAARIFEPFYTTKPSGKGTGLGLSVAHGIMESHGGSISVLSAPGIGTTFRLRFPPPRAQVPAELPAPSPALQRGKGEHILLVDDEATITNVATNLLRRLGYQVTARHDPREALHDFIAQPESFDLLLSDLTMPGMNGLDLIATIRATRPSLPCVLMSGYLGAEQEARTRAANLNGILDKPLATETLADAVSRALARS
jgi:PAS domain S-box-containing protein